MQQLDSQVRDLRWPVPVSAISRIGQTVMADRGNGQPHRGVDLFVPAGTPVSAPAAGSVLRVEDGRLDPADSGRGRAGLWVDVKDEAGLVHRFLHLRSSLVRAGQKVAAGELIGYTSDSGDSGIPKTTKPHLHYEIRSSDTRKGRYGAPIEPLSRLPPQSVEAAAPMSTSRGSAPASNPASPQSVAAAAPMSTPPRRMAVQTLQPDPPPLNLGPPAGSPPPTASSTGAVVLGGGLLVVALLYLKRSRAAR